MEKGYESMFTAIPRCCRENRCWSLWMCPVRTANALEMMLVKPTFDDQLSDRKSYYKIIDLFRTLHVK